MLDAATRLRELSPLGWNTSTWICASSRYRSAASWAAVRGFGGAPCATVARMVALGN
jgi:hypothetical protein